MELSRRDLLKGSGSVAATVGCGVLPLITPGQAHGDPLITSGQAVSISGSSLINLSAGGIISGWSLSRHEE